MKVAYTPSFIRQYKKLPKELQQEVKEKIAIFCKNHTHDSLRVHKLKGRLKGCQSFSVNYSYRIVFEYRSKSEATLLAVGDHSVYN